MLFFLPKISNTEEYKTVVTMNKHVLKHFYFMKIFVNKEYQSISIGSPKQNFGGQLLLKLFPTKVSVEDFNYAKHVSSILTFYFYVK